MANRLSRRKIALHAVNRLTGGSEPRSVIKEIAAFLVETRRTRELDLLIRDIEGELALRGTVIADVTSAYPLAAEMKKEIAQLVGAKDLQLRETIDPTVLGGVRVEIPGGRFDSTIKHRLLALKKAKQI
ncbi:MAG TPA: F0F1 ATP synthase subunit delta [Candidatus Saccharimonadales bacterium]